MIKIEKGAPLKVSAWWLSSELEAGPGVLCSPVWFAFRLTVSSRWVGPCQNTSPWEHEPENFNIKGLKIMKWSWSRKSSKSSYIKTKDLCTVPEIPHQRAEAAFPVLTLAHDLASGEMSAIAHSTKNNFCHLNHMLAKTCSSFSQLHRIY